MAIRYAWESSTGNTHLVENLDDAKGLAAAEYCDFIADIDPQDGRALEWKTLSLPGHWFLHADGELTTWLIRRVTSTTPSDYGV